MQSRWNWILIILAATAIDLFGRFSAGFDFARVLHIEAVLFPLTWVILATLSRREPVTHGWPRALRIGMVWLFGLGGLRPILWTLGVPLMTANIATLVILVVAILRWAIFRRRGASNAPTADTARSG